MRILSELGAKKLVAEDEDVDGVEARIGVGTVEAMGTGRLVMQKLRTCRQVT